MYVSLLGNKEQVFLYQAGGFDGSNFIVKSGQKEIGGCKLVVALYKVFVAYCTLVNNGIFFSFFAENKGYWCERRPQHSPQPGDSVSTGTNGVETRVSMVTSGTVPHPQLMGE